MINNREEIKKYMADNPQAVKSLLIDTITKLINTIFTVIIQWRRENEHPSEADSIGQCSMQMLVFNAQSILSLSTGIAIGSSTLYDINSAASILRSLYERVFIYHNIYISTSNEIERDILLYLWEIKGLNNRVTLKSVEEKFLLQKEEDAKNVFKLREKIRRLMKQLDMSNEAEMQMENTLKKDSSQLKGYIFKKNGNKITHFQPIPLEESPLYLYEKRDLANIYKYLSFTSHPSFLGTLQFGQRFNTNQDESEYINVILNNTYQLLSIASKDFCHGTNHALKYWDLLYPLTSFYFETFLSELNES